MTLAGLFLLALVAGTIDAIAGGGGLLTIPGLLAVGLNPLAALATNKMQGVFGPLTAMIHFWRKGRLRPQDLLLAGSAAFVGAVGGAAGVSLLNPARLKQAVPFLLIGIALWVLLSPKLGAKPGQARLPKTLFDLTVVPVIGFYDGFLGPGAGSFYALGGVAALGLGLDAATMRAKVCNFMSNLGGLAFFLAAGRVVWLDAVVMIVGTALGGNLGARLILLHGVGLIKPLLVIMSLAMSARLLWQQGLPTISP